MRESSVHFLNSKCLNKRDKDKRGFQTWDFHQNGYRGLTGGFHLLRIFSVAISESSCLFYLSFNFNFYVSKIMHLLVRNLPR